MERIRRIETSESRSNDVQTDEEPVEAIVESRSTAADVCTVQPTHTQFGTMTIDDSINPAVDDHSKVRQIFGEIKIQDNATVHFGNQNFYYGAQLFAGLRALELDNNSERAAQYRRSRSTTQSVSNSPTMPLAYLPHASVTQPELRKALVKIAVVSQTLDSAFAEYFNAVISHLERTAQILQRIKQQICSRQSGNVGYVGTLGEYCELTITISDPIARSSTKYQARATGDDILPYLQDALEVPYWAMMADQFVRSSQINDSLTYDAVICVINDKRRELNLRLRQVKQKWGNILPQVIQDGIVRRIGVLDDLLAQTSDKFDSLEEQQVQALQRSPTSGLDARADAPALSTLPEPASPTANASSSDAITDLERVSLLSLFFVFTAVAMVPFGIGFAGHWSAAPSEAIGSVSDPDFKWLIATTLLSIFGNIYAVVPLRKITRGSTANIISQAFLYLSILLGCFSVSVYPFWNKAWSSSLSFLCSYFAIGSVFVAAQYTSDTATATASNGTQNDDASKAKKD